MKYLQYAVSSALLLSLQQAHAQIQLTSEELHAGLQNGTFQVLVDVRRQDEWDTGRIEGATFIENLGSVVDTFQVNELLVGCGDNNEACNIAVYCRSGFRAGQAIDRLMNEYGFTGDRLYNGLGVNNWEDAGYSLTTTSESVIPRCSSFHFDNVIGVFASELDEGGEGTCFRVESDPETISPSPSGAPSRIDVSLTSAPTGSPTSVPTAAVPPPTAMTAAPMDVPVPTTVMPTTADISSRPSASPSNTTEESDRSRCIDIGDDTDTTSTSSVNGGRRRRGQEESRPRCNQDVQTGDPEKSGSTRITALLLSSMAVLASTAWVMVV